MFVFDGGQKDASDDEAWLVMSPCQGARYTTDGHGRRLIVNSVAIIRSTADKYTHVGKVSLSHTVVNCMETTVTSHSNLSRLSVSAGSVTRHRLSVVSPNWSQFFRAVLPLCEAQNREIN